METGLLSSELRLSAVFRRVIERIFRRYHRPGCETNGEERGVKRSPLSVIHRALLGEAKSAVRTVFYQGLQVLCMLASRTSRKAGYFSKLV